MLNLVESQPRIAFKPQFIETLELSNHKDAFRSHMHFIRAVVLLVSSWPSRKVRTRFCKLVVTQSSRSLSACVGDDEKTNGKRGLASGLASPPADSSAREAIAHR